MCAILCRNLHKMSVILFMRDGKGGGYGLHLRCLQQSRDVIEKINWHGSCYISKVSKKDSDRS